MRRSSTTVAIASLSAFVFGERDTSAARCDGFCPFVFVMRRVAFVAAGATTGAAPGFAGAVVRAAFPGFFADSG